MKDDDIVEIPGVKCVAQTPQALKIVEDDGFFWVPKSVVHDDSEVYRPDNEEGVLVVQRWWAEKEGRV